ncbi:hypothetical protein EDB81DRAFT_654139, partial [Dactylonectria macrodidyma]
LSLHKLACDYAQAWNLHRADAKDGALHNLLGRPISDDDRRSFWDLVHLDDSIMYFLVRARLWFITADFFNFIDPTNSQQVGPDILDKTHEMCGKIEELYSEWGIIKDYNDLLRGTNRDLKASWLTAEVALLGPITMVCMLRRATALVRGTAELGDVDAEIAKNPTVQKASRRMLKAASYFLDMHPSMCTVSSFFNILRIDLPYTYVARNIMQAADQSQVKEDKMLLDNIAKVLGAISQEIVALKPLAWATYRLNFALEFGG